MFFPCLRCCCRGKFSTVYLGKSRTEGTKVAIKVLNKQDDDFNVVSIKQEVDILRAVRHPNIIRLYDVFDEAERFAMVMEYVDGGELFDKIVEKGAYSEQDASRIMSQIFSAVEYLHSKGIVHRDLKPENLLCGSDETSGLHVYIADFGLSKICSENVILATACGTPGYVAPEVLQNDGTGKGYSNEVDMWSCGVILYILLCGFPPFYEEAMPDLFAQILDGRYDYPSPYWDAISASAKDLINHLLVVNPRDRLTASQARAHPFIAGTAASPMPIEHFQEKMAEWNAKRRLKAAVRAVMFANAAGLLHES